MVFDNCPFDIQWLNNQKNNEKKIALDIAKSNGKNKYFSLDGEDNIKIKIIKV